MGITYIPRVFGGTVIIITGPVVVPVPTLLIAATFRDGGMVASYRDGKQPASYRNGELMASYRDGQQPAQYRDGQVVAGGR